MDKAPLEEVAQAAGYEITKADVEALTSFAASLTVELYIVIALLVLIAGLLFASIATRFWQVG